MVESESLMREVATTSTDVKDTATSPDLGEIIITQLKTLSAYHRAVLETGEVEAIHKMRVTTRRLQASLDLLQTDGDELKVRKLKRQLRRWRRVLSRVRNYDVFLLLIENESSKRSLAHRQRFEHLKTILQKRRDRRVAKAQKYLEGISTDGIASKLGLSLAAPVTDASKAEAGADGNANLTAEAETSVEAKADAVPEAVNQGLIDKTKVTKRAAERIEQRVAEFQAFATQAHPTTVPAELHQLRIAAKRLRYLLEITSEMGYGDAARALAWLKSLQDRIGEWHDLEALEDEILQIITRRRFVKQNLGETCAILQAAVHLQKKKAALVSRLFPVKIPRSVIATSRRLAKTLGRSSLPTKPRTRPSGD